MFGLITGLIWVDPWIVKLMASRKNASGNRLDVGWQHGIDVDKNSRKDDLEIQIDDIGVGTSSSTNVHNIDVGTSSDTNNPLDANDID